jgi:hypothetical protein
MDTDLLVVGESRYLKYDTITYRDLEITFFSDPAGDLIIARLPLGDLLDFGYHNLSYREEACRVIDRQLDLIATFPDDEYEQAAKLEYFNNAGYRDIRLVYRGRALKVFLVANSQRINKAELIKEAKKFLILYGVKDA